TRRADLLKVAWLWKNVRRHAVQKYQITASIVPAWSMTSTNVISGEDGSRPISFSATTTWAELETGSSSATPCTTASMATWTRNITEVPAGSTDRVEAARLRRGGD